MKMKIRRLFIVLICYQLFMPYAWADNSAKITEFALPSDVKDLDKSAGAVFYSPTAKGSVLVPVHFWGEVTKSGLHYIPVDSNLVKGLSFAGGPRSTAQLESVKVTRQSGTKVEELRFDLSQGGNSSAYNFNLHSGDTVFVEKDYYYENRIFYTGLIGVVATLLSSFVIFREVKK